MQLSDGNMKTTLLNIEKKYIRWVPTISSNIHIIVDDMVPSYWDDEILFISISEISNIDFSEYIKGSKEISDGKNINYPDMDKLYSICPTIGGFFNSPRGLFWFNQDDEYLRNNEYELERDYAKYCYAYALNHTNIPCIYLVGDIYAYILDAKEALNYFISIKADYSEFERIVFMVYNDYSLNGNIGYAMDYYMKNNLSIDIDAHNEFISLDIMNALKDNSSSKYLLVEDNATYREIMDKLYDSDFSMLAVSLCQYNCAYPTINDRFSIFYLRKRYDGTMGRYLLVLKEDGSYIVWDRANKEYILKENYIISNKDICCNIDKFDSGEINLLAVIGHSGSGKTTTAYSKGELSNAEVYELDDLVYNDRFSDDNLKEYGGLYYDFFKGVGKKYRKTDNGVPEEYRNDPSKYDIDLYNAFFKYAFSYINTHKSTRYILEGIWWCYYIKPQQLEKYAVLIKGTSALKSLYRAIKRDKRINFLIKNRLDMEKRLKNWTNFYRDKSLSESLNESSRKDLPNEIFGIPEDRKYPLDTKEHIISAMKLFGHCSPSKKKSLAKNIERRANEEGIELMPAVKKCLSEATLLEARYGELVIIDPDATGEELEYQYAQYNELPNRLRRQSNDEAIRQHGMTNDEIYERQAYSQDVEKLSRDIDPEEDYELTLMNRDVRDELSMITTIEESIDLVHRYKHTLYYLNEDGFNNEIPDFPVDNDMTEELPEYVPYFNPEEIEQLVPDEDSEFLMDYRNHCPIGLADFDYQDDFTDIQHIYEKYIDTKDPILERKIISMGWNPSIEPTIENMKYARDRIKKYINERYKVDIVNVSNMAVQENLSSHSSKLHPVYIVLSYFNSSLANVVRLGGSEYAHAAIGIGGLKHLYTFGSSSDGFREESIDNYTKRYEFSLIKILCVFVDDKQFSNMKKNIKYYKDHIEDTRYSFMNNIRIILGLKKHGDKKHMHLICSEFVDTILKLGDVDLTNKPSNLVSPGVFERIDNPSVYVLYEGLSRDCIISDIENKAKALTVNVTVCKTLNLDEACDYLYKYPDILLYKMIGITETTSESVMKQLREVLCAKRI